MSREEKLDLLKRWADRINAVDDFVNNIITTLGANPEKFEPIFLVNCGYTSAIGRLVGDRHDWMEYFQFECDMGRRPMTVKCGDDVIKLYSIELLLELIEMGDNDNEKN